MFAATEGHTVLAQVCGHEFNIQSVGKRILIIPTVGRVQQQIHTGLPGYTNFSIKIHYRHRHNGDNGTKICKYGATCSLFVNSSHGENIQMQEYEIYGEILDEKSAVEPFKTSTYPYSVDGILQNSEATATEDEYNEYVYLTSKGPTDLSSYLALNKVTVTTVTDDNRKVETIIGVVGGFICAAVIVGVARLTYQRWRLLHEMDVDANAANQRLSDGAAMSTSQHDDYESRLLDNQTQELTNIKVTNEY